MDPADDDEVFAGWTHMHAMAICSGGIVSCGALLSLHLYFSLTNQVELFNLCQCSTYYIASFWDVLKVFLVLFGIKIYVDNH